MIYSPVPEAGFRLGSMSKGRLTVTWRPQNTRSICEKGVYTDYSWSGIERHRDAQDAVGDPVYLLLVYANVQNVRPETSRVGTSDQDSPYPRDWVTQPLPGEIT